MEKWGYIYKFTMIPTNKIYIGKRKHKKFDNSYWGSGKYWRRVLKKYGKENVIREVLEWTYSEEESVKQEKYWIKKLNSTNISIGYNISEGGHTPSLPGSKNGMWKHIWTEEEKQHQIDGLKNRDFWGDNNPSRRPEVINKLKEISTGHSVSKEARNRLSEFNTGLVHITNGNSNLNVNKNNLTFYLITLNLGYHLGTTNHLNCKHRKDFIQITNGIINHKIPLKDFEVWNEYGWVRGSYRKRAAQRRVQEFKVEEVNK